MRIHGPFFLDNASYVLTTNEGWSKQTKVGQIDERWSSGPRPLPW